MAGKGRIQNLTPFKPGNCGNVAGRAGVLPAEIRSERKKNQAGLIRLISELMMMTPKEAASQKRNKSVSQLELAAHKLVAQAKKGDLTSFRYLIELMVGKIPEHDYDGFTEDDVRILNRVKEVQAETASRAEPDPVGSGH